MAKALHTSVDTAAAANEDTRIDAYNSHFEGASGSLARINALAATDLTAATTRMSQISELLAEIEINGTTVAATEAFRSGNKLAIGGSTTTPAALPTMESGFLDLVKPMFNGNLEEAWSFIKDAANKVADANAAVEKKAKQLREEEDAHKATKAAKPSIAVDQNLVNERNALKADKARLETELAAEQAKKTPAVVDDADIKLAVELANALHGNVEHKASHMKKVWTIPDAVMTPRVKSLLGESLDKP